MQQYFNMGHDNRPLVGTVVRLTTTDRGRTTGIDTEFKTNDGITNARGVKTVPVEVDNGDDFVTCDGGDMSADDKVFQKFCGIARRVPFPNVGAGIDKDERWLDHGFAVFFKKEDTIVDVIAILQRCVAVMWSGTPELGRNFNNKRGSGGGRGVRQRATGEGGIMSGEYRGKATAEVARGEIIGCDGGNGAGSEVSRWRGADEGSGVVAGKRGGIKRAAIR